MFDKDRARVIHIREDWESFLAYRQPEKPQAMDKAEYQILNKNEQQVYDLDRDLWHSDFGTGRTALLENCRREFYQLARRNLLGNHPVAAHIAISGEPTLGKTTIAQTLGKIFDREYRLIARRKGVDLDGDEQVCPVIYISVSPNMTIKGLNDQILTYFGAIRGRKRSTGHDLEMAAIEMIRRHQSRLIILDDIHLLKPGRENSIGIRDYIKPLTSRTSLMALIVGIDLEKTDLFGETFDIKSGQTGGRTNFIKVERFNKSEVDWRNVIEWAERNLILFNHQYGSLGDLEKYLWNRTQGRIGPLMTLIQLSALEAVASKKESINKCLLEEIRLDLNSQANKGLVDE